MQLSNEEKIRRVLNPRIVIDEVKEKINIEERKRNSLPDIKLDEIEYAFLKGLIEGRKKFEIVAGLRLLGEKRSYSQILGRILVKFDALNLPNAIYKAIKMGLI